MGKGESEMKDQWEIRRSMFQLQHVSSTSASCIALISSATRLTAILISAKHQVSDHAQQHMDSYGSGIAFASARKYLPCTTQSTAS